jgi:hypothetical protein
MKSPNFYAVMFAGVAFAATLAACGEKPPVDSPPEPVRSDKFIDLIAGEWECLSYKRSDLDFSWTQLTPVVTFEKVDDNTINIHGLIHDDNPIIGGAVSILGITIDNEAKTMQIPVHCATDWSEGTMTGHIIPVVTAGSGTNWDDVFPAMPFVEENGVLTLSMRTYGHNMWGQLIDVPLENDETITIDPDPNFTFVSANQGVWSRTFFWFCNTVLTKRIGE